MNKHLAYLAGPGVFRPDALAHGEALKRLCADHGIVGLYPLDSDSTQPATARHIFAANCAKIERANVVIADLSPFRGPHADDGTAWEVGYAFAREKPVFSYSADPRPLMERIGVAASARNRSFDSNGWEIEDFGRPVNLMLAISIKGIYDTDEEAIAAAAKWLGERSM